MSNKTGLIGLGVMVGLVLLAGWFFRAPVTGQEKAVAAVPKWEYRIILLDNGPDNDPRANQAQFDRLGAEGWELSALDNSNRPGFCVFKRPKR